MSEHCTCATSDYCQVHDEITRLRAEVANYATLKRAVNESTNECSPHCNDYCHAGDCPANNSARWLEDQQREIERLRGILRRVVSGELNGITAGEVIIAALGTEAPEHPFIQTDERQRMGSPSPTGIYAADPTSEVQK